MGLLVSLAWLVVLAALGLAAVGFCVGVVVMVSDVGVVCCGIVWLGWFIVLVGCVWLVVCVGIVGFVGIVGLVLG